MKILKFGGTSVGSSDGIQNVLGIVTKNISAGNKIAIIASAFSKVTDTLISLGKCACQNGDFTPTIQMLRDRHLNALKGINSQNRLIHATNHVNTLCDELEQLLRGVSLIGELSPRTLDLIMSFGERLSAYIVSELIRSVHPNTAFLDARTVLHTDNNFNHASVDMPPTIAAIQNHFSATTDLQIITGYIGRGPNGETTTLGRGGSDYSAAIFAVALNATEVEIWTDVDGVMTADPRRVKKAFTIPELTYKEAMELSHFGAKVIYPPTIQPTLVADIPIRILNTFNPEAPGTLVSTKQPCTNRIITGISSMSNVAVIRFEGSGLMGIAGTAGRLFTALARYNVNVILISQGSSEHSICFAVMPEAVQLAIQAIQHEFAFEIASHKFDEIVVDKDCSIVAVVGENMRATPGVSGRLFQALGKNGINVFATAQGSSELNISVVISKNDETKAVASLHDAFFLSDRSTINLFLVGPGAVGSTLLSQLSKEHDTLESIHQFDFRLAGIANSKRMAFADGRTNNAIQLNAWQQALNESQTPTDLHVFVSTIKSLNLPNSVFIDTTANDSVASLYESLLDSSVCIVTPNKRANSSTFSQYKKLKDTAKKRNVSYFYETTVGAGLPVISTLNDLLNSGDSIIRIEAVLSGTLSFIFNSFTPDRNFSDVVKEAKEKGYTEPDPRDDLSGMDVMRKLLILAREMGLTLESGNISVESLVPESCSHAKSVDDFFVALQQYADLEFKKRQQEAIALNQVLRYIASIENGNACVSLQAVDANHPFYNLSGSDNIISFTTTRYMDRPLVVKGPGAGTSVTAAGIFADVFKTATYLR